MRESEHQIKASVVSSEEGHAVIGQTIGDMKIARTTDRDFKRAVIGIRLRSYVVIVVIIVIRCECCSGAYSKAKCRAEHLACDRDVVVIENHNYIF